MDSDPRAAQVGQHCLEAHLRLAAMVVVPGAGGRGGGLARHGRSEVVGIEADLVSGYVVCMVSLSL